MGVLDSIDGGAGTDTLNIVDSVSIPARNITATGIETVVVNSTAGSVGAIAADAKVATKQKVIYTFGTNEGTSVGAGPLKITYGGSSQTIANATVANAVTLDKVVAAINELAGATVAETTSTTATGSITITAPTAGVALPTIAFENGSYKPQGSSTTTTNAGVDVTPATNYSFPVTLVSSQAASDATTASTFAVPTGATTATLTAKTALVASAPSTAAVTAKGTVVVLSGGASQTVTASNSVKLSGTTGAISVTQSTAPTTSLLATDYTGWAEGAGVFIRGGSTVNVTAKAGAFTSTGTATAAAANSKAVQIGSDPFSAELQDGSTGTVPTATASTYPRVVGNLSDAPTGDVTSSVKTTFTDDYGFANVTYGTGVTKVYMNGGTTASVTGAGATTIRDLSTVPTKASSTATAAPGTSKLTTVNLTGVSGATGIYTDALSTVSIVDSSSTVTVNSNTGSNKTALNVSVGNSTATVDASVATSIAVTGVQSANNRIGTTDVAAANSASTLTLTTPKATSVSFGGTSAITLASSTLSLVTSMTASGSGKLDLGTPTSYAKLTSFDGSAATGKIVASLGATITGSATDDHAFAFTSGSGNDTVTLTGAMKSGTSGAGASINNTINLGAGNDTLLKNGGSIAAGSTVAGGEGTDTIAATLLTVGNSAQITGFEVLGLDVASNSSFDTDLLVGATGLSLISAGGTYTNVETSQALTIGVDVTAGTNTITFGTAVTTGTADSYSVTMNYADTSTAATDSANEVDGGVLVIENIETVNLSSTGSGNIKNALNLTDASARVLNITGDKNLNLDFGALDTDDTNSTTHFFGTSGSSTTSDGVSLIDASAFTGKLDIDTTDVAIAYAGLTVKGGSNKDTITLAQVATVDGGANDDTIKFNAGASGSVATGGAGNDTFDVSLATVADVTSDSTLKYVTINDFATGDILMMSATTAASNAYVNANSVVATAGTLKAALTAALTASTLSTAVADANVWFTYGGNTFVAHQDANDGFGTGDVVVKLIGAHTLSAANVVAAATGLFGQA